MVRKDKVAIGGNVVTTRTCGIAGEIVDIIQADPFAGSNLLSVTATDDASRIRISIDCGPRADGRQQEVLAAVRNRCPAKLLPSGHKPGPCRIAASEVKGPVIEVDCGLSIDDAGHIEGVGIVRVGKASVQIERDGEDGASSGRTGQ